MGAIPKIVLPQDQQVLLTEEDFSYFCGLIRELAGIHLASAKASLVQGRLRQHVQSLGLASFSEYREYLKSLPAGHAEFQEFVNLLTTNKTEFFREREHFLILETYAREFRQRYPQETLRIWCAASSTGEEPYTLAIVLARVGGPFEVFASDIDTEVLMRAQRGVYPAEQLGQVPEEYRAGGFDLGRGDIEGWMRVKPSIHGKVKFFQHNLISPELPEAGTFDLVFCRNVLIYFRPETCRQIVTKIYETVKPGGMLIIGHSESLQNVKTLWRMERPSVYRKGKA